MLPAFTLFLMLCGAEQSYAVLVETKYGTVQGQVETLTDDYHYGFQLNTFYSIPFARPPVGDLRFTVPEEPDSYEDVVVADRIKSACDQDSLEPLWSDISEDCLHLNIFAPADADDAPYPVMIYLHGGGYTGGANWMYLGHFLSAQGTVVVVPNYRLGIMGFAYSGDDVIPGNMGLMDQALAMQYVQENIAAFGGDPNHVTIFGTSAGAASIGLHIVSPKTEGLFHQAILESGCEYTNWALNGPQHEPENYLKEVAEKLNCPTEDSNDMADCLRNKTADELRNTSFTCAEGRHCLGFAPVVDGEGGYIPDVPWNLRLREEFHKVPEIIGINRNEEFSSLTSCCVFMTYEKFEDEIRESVAERVAAFPDPSREEDVVQAALYYYTPWPHFNDSQLLRHQYGEYLTDQGFGVSADEQAKQHCRHAPVYYYIYDYMREGALPEWMGTPHGFNVPYEFGYPFISQNPHLQNKTGLPGIADFDEVDFEYSHFMLTLWTNFAKHGTPTPNPVETPGGHQPVVWRPFTEEELNYIYIGRDVLEMNVNFRQHEYAFWQSYMTYLLLGEEGINPYGRGSLHGSGNVLLEDDAPARQGD